MANGTGDVDAGPRRVPIERILELLEERRRRASFGEDRPGRTGARQPAQPASGPGGADYPHREVKFNLYGEGELAYWLFEPAVPTPRSAPLVVLIHGWGGGSPARKGAWIDHLVKRGCLVVFPAYQGSLNPWARPWDRTPPDRMLERATVGVRAALEALRGGSHVRPDLERFAILGSSLGGALAVQMAATATTAGLPAPRAIMAIAPSRGLWSRRPVPPVDLRGLPASLSMLLVVCEEDKNAGDSEAKVVFARTRQIPAERKNLVMVMSDYHGTPPVVANHNSPAASNPLYGVGEREVRPPGAIHYYGYWKLFDGLTDAAFHGKNREYAFGDTPEQRFMGRWSDGVPVKELRVVTSSDTMSVAPPSGRRPRFDGPRWPASRPLRP